MENPNEYDDDAYLEASNELVGNLPEILNKLWAAGASHANIMDELNNAIDSSDIPPEGRVTVIPT